MFELTIDKILIFTVIWSLNITPDKRYSKLSEHFIHDMTKKWTEVPLAELDNEHEKFG